jgi:hypothetical protein
VDVFVEVPSLAWSTGWTFLGANVSMFLSQPGYILTAWNSATAGPPFSGASFYREVSNTWVTPVELSWNIGGSWFASTGFAVHIPDGTRFNNTTNPDYWTYEPHAALTYFSNEWNFTADLTYDFNTASAGHTGVFAATPLAAFGRGYWSGDQVFLNLSGTRKFGKWEIGPVAYFMWQTNADRPGAGFSCSSLAATTQLLITCGRATDYAIGGLIGYDFGPAALKLFMTDSIYTQDNVGGLAFWSKLSFKIGELETPSPAKSAIRK